MVMNALDWVLIAIGVFAVLRGMMRGAISQVFGIAGLIGGFFVAARFYQDLSVQLSLAVPKLSASQAHIAGFIMLFFLTWFCIVVVGHWIAKVLHRTGLGFLDRLWGAAVGFGKALVFAVVIISALTFLLTARSSLLTQSYLTPYVQEAARFVVKATPDRVQSLFREKQDELKRYWLDRKDDQKESDLFGKKELRT